MIEKIIDEPIRLQTSHGEFNARYISEPSVAREGVVLYGDYEQPKEPILLRVQSSCLFSESFWSSDCDCALQLQESLRQIRQTPGLVVYFYEEGRGHGLQMKMHAIHLQQLNSWDTAKAFHCLGATIDARTPYTCLPEVIRAVFGQDMAVAVLTNSPGKLQLVENSGVKVVSKQPLVCGLENPQIRAYLSEKKLLLKHDIPLE